MEQEKRTVSVDTGIFFTNFAKKSRYPFGVSIRSSCSMILHIDYFSLTVGNFFLFRDNEKELSHTFLHIHYF